MGMEPRPPQWEASTQAKSYSKSLLIAIRNIYMSLQHGSPLCMCYMNLPEHTLSALRCRLNSTCKSLNPEYWHQTLARPHVQCQARLITSSLWWDLTKSSPSSTRGPETAWHVWPGIEPGPPRWEASTLAKSYSKSILIAIRNTYMSPRPILLYIRHCMFVVHTEK